MYVNYLEAVRPPLLSFVVDPATASLVGAGIGAAGNLLGNFLNYKSASKTNATNLQIAREANELNYKMFTEGNDFNKSMMLAQQAFESAESDKERHYNSASEQVRRLLAAGLNPHIVENAGMYNAAQAQLASASSHSGAVAPQLVAPQIDARSVSDGMKALSDVFLTLRSQDSDTDLRSRALDIEERNARTSQKAQQSRSTLDIAEAELARQRKETEVKVLGQIDAMVGRWSAMTANEQEQIRIADEELVLKKLHYALEKQLTNAQVNNLAAATADLRYQTMYMRPEELRNLQQSWNVMQSNIEKLNEDVKSGKITNAQLADKLRAEWRVMANSAELTNLQRLSLRRVYDRLSGLDDSALIQAINALSLLNLPFGVGVDSPYDKVK